MFWNTIYNWKFIKNYNSYYDNYMKLNYLIQEIKSIITESINISENEHPLIKYFTFSKYKRKFWKRIWIQNKNLYFKFILFKSR